jgi:hypothetical protein
LLRYIVFTTTRFAKTFAGLGKNKNKNKNKVEEHHEK